MYRKEAKLSDQLDCCDSRFETYEGGSIDFSEAKPVLYDTVKNNYEYIIEDEDSASRCLLGTSQFSGSRTNANLSGGSMDDNMPRNNMFRKRANPLYIASCDDLLLSKMSNSPSPQFMVVLVGVFVISLLSIILSSFTLYKMCIFEESSIIDGNRSQYSFQNHQNSELFEMEPYSKHLLQSLLKNVSLAVEKIDSLEIDLKLQKAEVVKDKTELKKMVINMSLCKYETFSAGGSSNLGFTYTDPRPKDDEQTNWVVTGVSCSVTGGTTSVLQTSKSSGIMQYLCNCTGNVGNTAKRSFRS